MTGDGNIGHPKPESAISTPELEAGRSTGNHNVSR